MVGIRFVPQTGTKEDDRNTRKSIRRHVMLGKNQGRTLNPKQPTLEGCAVFRKDDWEQTTQPINSVIPRRVGSDLSFLEFADTVELPLMSDTLQFCSATNEKLFALEPCISFDSTGIAATCLQSLTCDALHLNIMVFGAQAYMDQIFRQTTLERRRSPHKAVLQHYGKALSLLRERLVDIESQRSEIFDITIMSVVTLATHALVTGERERAANHIVGLSRLVSTRQNGLYSFRSKPKMMLEVLRCDISLTLVTGETPLFFSDVYREPIFPLPELTAPDQTSEHHPIIEDRELAKLWDVLRRFCAIINEAVNDQRRIPDQILLDTTAAVMYRLLNMSFAASSADGVIRLAMISFCASALLSLGQIQIPFRWLRVEHKRSMAELMQSHIHLLGPAVALWCLLIYGIAFSLPFTAEDEDVQSWLVETTDLCKLTSWDSAKSVVDNFLWINIVCDHPARQLIEETLRRRNATTGIVEMPCIPLAYLLSEC